MCGTEQGTARIRHTMHIREIHAIHLKRARVNHDTYKSLFLACCEGIRRRAMLVRQGELSYRVPRFVWGRPAFKHRHATRYVAEKLRRNGFTVTEVDPGRDPGALLVTWEPPRAEQARAHARAQARAHARRGGGGANGSRHASGRVAASAPLSARLAALRDRLG